MEYSDHGVYKIRVERNLLVVEAKGPFNEITVQNYFNEVKQIVNDFHYRKWGQLTIFEGFSAFIPLAELIMIDQVSWKLSKGMIATALVLQKPEGKSLIEDQMNKIYRKVGIKYAIFDDYIEASRWIKPQLSNDSHLLK